MAKSKEIKKPSANKASEAVKTLIRWAGDDPGRAGMADTPERVLQFYREFFTGYGKSPEDYAGSIANNDVRYDDFILVQDIRIASFCEHHFLPAAGRAHVAYVPGEIVAGIGTLARIASDCARRLTTQEAVTCDIITMIGQAFAPQGVAVSVSLSHGCMGLRGGEQAESRVTTTKFSGVFAENTDIKNQFLLLTGLGRAQGDPTTKRQ